ncbi:hypothetical protein IFM89_010488 [Coptis chinensis]|uniref:Uncharacterized protein n=1 Tax=Coptis chinensis TaxID=261450 RepID=A0A835IC10_9MAGN|nr:hypothetical protein IFM89_010488 [Coptis chinensis]
MLLQQKVTFETGQEDSAEILEELMLREHRGNRSVLFDGIEEGGIRATVYSHDVNDHDNEKALDGLHDRVNLLRTHEDENQH